MWIPAVTHTEYKDLWIIWFEVSHKLADLLVTILENIMDEAYYASFAKYVNSISSHLLTPHTLRHLGYPLSNCMICVLLNIFSD